MRLKFCGAAQEVTGSNYLLEVGGHRVLIDCGVHQGEGEYLNEAPFPYAANSIDAVVLTHAHIDHSGRIPKLVKEGFRGKIYATLPTVELAEILWDDSVRLMREEAEWKTRKNQRRGLPPAEPLYTQEDADAAKKQLAPMSYDSRFEAVPGVSVRFRDAGHILGSSLLECVLTEDEKVVRLVFSGDLGPVKTVMERPPAEIGDADYVVIESTYGGREHKSIQETRNEFQTLMEDILAKKKSKIFIPTFAVGRAQRIMYELAVLRDKGVGGHIPVFFDSPMGVRATKLYDAHMDMLSHEIQDYRRREGSPFSEEDLQYVVTKEESQAVNRQKFGIVLAGSGMCNGGRIIHHLKNGLWNPDNHVIFVGYQAHGTLGRRIVDGAKSVRIAGETVNVNAAIHTIGGFSAHADRSDLLHWAEAFRLSMPYFFVTHGEPESAKSLSDALSERGFDTLVPHMLQEVTLTPRSAGQRMSEAAAESQAVSDSLSAQTGSVETKVADKPVREESPKTPQTDQRLMGALEKLGDQLRDLYQRAEDGSLNTDVQPLLDAVSVLLETAAQKSRR